MNTLFPFSASLKKQFSSEEQFATFLSYLQRLVVRKRQFLFHKGDRADGIYLVASGQVTSVSEMPDRRLKRLQTFKPGEVVGEGEYYCNVPRLASLVAEQPSVVYYLSSSIWDQMELEAPGAAIAFHRHAFGSLSVRLGYVKETL
ncbi:cyclic nucleotide-binding domain-containing protein [Phormidium tenue FACHB-886]|nr:cyclic nucleotide-binding domain-containing protein [Phormidium tenue FACHB-886]